MNSFGVTFCCSVFHCFPFFAVLLFHVQVLLVRYEGASQTTQHRDNVGRLGLQEKADSKSTQMLWIKFSRSNTQMYLARGYKQVSQATHSLILNVDFCWLTWLNLLKDNVSYCFYYVSYCFMYFGAAVFLVLRSWSPQVIQLGQLLGIETQVSA